MKNWWYYHKWYVICGIILFLSIVDIIANKFGWFKDTPDVQIAYIGENALEEDTLAVLKERFASLADDYNHDGKVIVQINPYVTGPLSSTDPEVISYRQATEITLIGDIEDCESYFFLMDNPENVQRQFQILAMPDGSCPADTDISAEDKVVPWDFNLYLGRRYFYGEKRSDHADECAGLWDSLQGGTDKDVQQ